MRDPDGLLAIGGDLSLPRLLNAYRHGIFPWFSPGQPPLWWSPDPRMVFRTDCVRLSSRFRRALKQSTWQIPVSYTHLNTLQADAVVIAGHFTYEPDGASLQAIFAPPAGLRLPA